MSVTFLSWANWREEMSITERWSTSVFAARTNSETRKGKRDRPTRDLDYTTLFAGTTQVQQSWGLLQAMARTRNPLPFIPDVSRLTAGASGATINCDTEYRNFKADYWVVLAHVSTPGNLGVATSTETTQYFPMQIQSLTSTSITFTASLPETFNTGDVVFPAILSEIAFAGAGVTVFGPERGTVEMRVREVYGSGALPAANTAYSPTMYNGYPYLDLDINWRNFPEMAISRPATVQKSGRYQVADFLTDNTRAGFSITVSAMTREATWNLRGQMSYMKGRLNTFWFKGLQNIFTVGATQSSAKIELESEAGEDNLDLVHGIYIENAAGQVDFITGQMLFTGPKIEFVYDNTTSVTSVTIARPAYLVRSSKDNFDQTWFSLNVLEVPMSLIEATEAYDV